MLKFLISKNSNIKKLFKNYKIKNYGILARGFSLLELLIYIAILGGFLLVMGNLFYMILSGSAREEARTEVRQNLRFAISQIANEIRSANDIFAPTTGNSGNILDLNTGGNITRFSVSPQGILQKTQKPGSIEEFIENITSDKVKVNTINPPSIFTRLDNGDAKPSLQIILTISYNDNGKSDYEFSETVQTTVSLRNDPV